MSSWVFKSKRRQHVKLGYAARMLLYHDSGHPAKRICIAGLIKNIVTNNAIMILIPSYQLPYLFVTLGRKINKILVAYGNFYTLILA